jgi:hypothetical protein
MSNDEPTQIDRVLAGFAVAHTAALAALVHLLELRGAVATGLFRDAIAKRSESATDKNERDALAALVSALDATSRR